MTKSTRYIEVVGGVGVWQVYLVDANLRSIGKLTRENVANWLDGPDGIREPACFPIEDFHVVCDDIDIPWATQEGRDTYRRVTTKT
jgi:hypothetical protein